MGDATARLLATIVADDKASPAIKLVAGTMLDLGKAAESAASSSDKLGGSSGTAGFSLDGMGSKMAKASIPLRLLSNELGGLGSGIAGAETKIAKFAMLMSSGGPLGIALAAGSAAIGAGVLVWQTYQIKVQAAEDAIKSVNKAFDAMRGRIDVKNDKLKESEKILADWGVTAESAALRDSAASVHGSLVAQIALEKELEARKAKLEALKAEGAAAQEAFELEKKLLMSQNRGGESEAGSKANRIKEEIAEETESIALGEKGLATARESTSVSQRQFEIDKAIAAEREKDSTRKLINDKLTIDSERAIAAAKAETARVAKAMQDDADADWKRGMDQQKRDREDAEEGERQMWEDRKDMAEDWYTHHMAILARKDAARKRGEKDQDKAFADETRSSVSAAQQSERAWANAGASMVDASGAAMLSWIDGSKTGSQAAKAAARDAGMVAIRTAAATAATEQIAAHAGIPFVGLAIGVAAAAAISTIILGYLTKFHSGGVVGSNDGVRLPGMAPNERMVNVMVGEPIGMARQGGGASGGGGGVTVNYRSLFAPTSADTKRMINQVGKLQRRQHAMGHA